jgi:hypothetical protein
LIAAFEFTVDGIPDLEKGNYRWLRLNALQNAQIFVPTLLRRNESWFNAVKIVSTSKDIYEMNLENFSRNKYSKFSYKMPRRQQLLKYLRKSSFSCSLSLAKLEYEK